MSYAKKDCIFLHCLPRGSEVSNEVFLGKKSHVWQQALNRVHVQKSILLYCFGKLYEKGYDQGIRKKWLLTLGISSIFLFIILMARSRVISFLLSISFFHISFSRQFLLFFRSVLYQCGGVYRLLVGRGDPG